MTRALDPSSRHFQRGNPMANKALVTGASGGIGKAIAESLAKEGWEVTLVARNAARLKDNCAAMGPAHKALAADLSTEAGVKAVADELRQTRYQLLVNNAGVGVYGRFEQTPMEKNISMMRLNMDALVTLSHVFLQTAQKGDALINVASTLAYLSYPGASLYAATKAFVTNFSEGLWFENKDRGVFVTALCPGVTETDFHTASGGKEADRPPKNLAQTPQDVAGVTLRLLKERSGPSTISGTQNNVMVFATRFMSGKAKVKMMGSFSPKDSAPV